MASSSEKRGWEQAEAAIEEWCKETGVGVYHIIGPYHSGKSSTMVEHIWMTFRERFPEGSCSYVAVDEQSAVEMIRTRSQQMGLTGPPPLLATTRQFVDFARRLRDQQGVDFFTETGEFCVIVDMELRGSITEELFYGHLLGGIERFMRKTNDERRLAVYLVSAHEGQRTAALFEEVIDLPVKVARVRETRPALDVRQVTVEDLVRGITDQAAASTQGMFLDQSAFRETVLRGAEISNIQVWGSINGEESAACILPRSARCRIEDNGMAVLFCMGYEFTRHVFDRGTTMDVTTTRPLTREEMEEELSWARAATLEGRQVKVFSCWNDTGEDSRINWALAAWSPSKLPTMLLHVFETWPNTPLDRLTLRVPPTCTSILRRYLEWLKMIGCVRGSVQDGFRLLPLGACVLEFVESASQPVKRSLVGFQAAYILATLKQGSPEVRASRTGQMLMAIAALLECAEDNQTLSGVSWEDLAKERDIAGALRDVCGRAIGNLCSRGSLWFRLGILAKLLEMGLADGRAFRNPYELAPWLRVTGSVGRRIVDEVYPAMCKSLGADGTMTWHKDGSLAPEELAEIEAVLARVFTLNLLLCRDETPSFGVHSVLGRKVWINQEEIGMFSAEAADYVSSKKDQGFFIFPELIWVRQEDPFTGWATHCTVIGRDALLSMADWPTALCDTNVWPPKLR